MLQLRIFLAAALAASTAALPSPASPIVLVQDDGSSATSTASLSKTTYSTGVASWMDNMFATVPKGEEDWVNTFWKTLNRGQGASPLTGCSEIGSDCNPPPLCSDYQSQMAYWTFRSVGILHSKINTVHSKLLWTGWLESLSIDQISKDFSSVTPNPTWAKWLAAAFTMAGGFTTGIDLSKPLRGMIGFAAGGMTNVGLTDSGGDSVDTTSVQNTLKNIVGAAGDYVAGVLKNATGNGESTTLPIYTQSTLQTGTGRFFSDNTILLDENKDNSSFVAAYDTFADNVEKKLVDVALKTAWYTLVGEDPRNAKEKDCVMDGAFWLEGKKGEFRCFYLSRPKNSHYCKDDDPKTVPPHYPLLHLLESLLINLQCVSDAWQSPYNTNNKMDKKIYSKLTDSYGFDLKVRD
ncbi:hypothetical protein N7512_003210 [Penicillium capsulatum]|nr:hypothetical protein N7512_003210 [Penicillium capsulatum]